MLASVLLASYLWWRLRGAGADGGSGQQQGAADTDSGSETDRDEGRALSDSDEDAGVSGMAISQLGDLGDWGPVHTLEDIE